MFFKFRLDKKVGREGSFFYFFVLFFGRRVRLVFFGLLSRFWSVLWPKKIQVVVVF